MTVKRTTQAPVETVSQADPKLRDSQLAVEAVSANALVLRASQLAVEAISEHTLSMRVSSLVVEMVSPVSRLLMTHLAAEVVSVEETARRQPQQMVIAT